LYKEENCAKITGSAELRLSVMKAKDRMGIARAFAMVSQIGITMIVCVFGGVWIGNWLDEKLGTPGICLIVCIFIGIIGGFMNVYKLLTKGMGNKK